MKSRIALALLLSTSSAWAERPPMRPGMWQITTRMEMRGAPNFGPGGREFTVRHCITKRDVEREDAGIPKNDQNRNCAVSDVHRSGNTASWKMVCNGRQKMTGAGEMHYGSDNYQGTITMHSESGGQNMDMVQHVKGKRVGECR